MFKDPVEILPATNYTASATLKVNSAAGMNISSCIKIIIKIGESTKVIVTPPQIFVWVQ